jgi:hypothetical protein
MEVAQYPVQFLAYCSKELWRISQRDFGRFFSLLKSWVTQNFIIIKTSWNTND